MEGEEQRVNGPAGELSAPGEELLRLFLGISRKCPRRVPHPDAWEFLTIRDLVNVSLVSSSMRENLKWIEYVHCRDGRDYLVPFPGFPGLLSTPADHRMGAGLFRHQLASLRAMHRAENSNCSSFGSLRGGILGDAPGLGKTITMLALIASTAGVRTVQPPEFWDQEGIKEGWKILRSNPALREDLLKILAPIRRWIYGHILDPKNVEIYRELERYVCPPYPDNRLQNAREFEIHVKRTLRAFVPLSELELFRQRMMHWRARLDKRNRKVLSRGIKGQRLFFERTLIPSSATLVVVPDALLEHWFQQVEKHFNLARFVDENEQRVDNEDATKSCRNVVYLDGIGDLADATVPLGRVSLDREVPPPWYLSKYLIVVTTFSRCRGEFQKEVAAGRMKVAAVKNKTRKRKRERDAVRSGYLSEPSALLKIRWLRLVVDEGHELGTHETGTSVTLFIHEIAAERRWVLSGTPTTGNEDQVDFSAKGLDQLQRLLFFLRHPLYGNIPPTHQGNFQETSYLDGDDYNDKKTESAGEYKAQAMANFIANVKEPFLKREERGLQELLRLFDEVMVMHRKEDIALPTPIFRQLEADVPIPDDVQAQLMAADGLKKLEDYLFTEDFQSLVDQAQAKYIIKVINDAKKELAKCGGPLLKGENSSSVALAEFDPSVDSAKIDRRPIKAVVYSSVKNNLLSVAEHLYRELSTENIAEMHGGIGDMSSELSRFRNDCKESRQCTVCGAWNDLGGGSQTSRRFRRCQNMLLEVTVLDSPQVRCLVEPERVYRALVLGEADCGTVPVHRMGGEPMTSYGFNSKFWRVGDVLEVDFRDPHPLLPKRKSTETWRNWGSGACMNLAEQNNFEGSDWFFGPLPWNGTKDRVLVRLAKWQGCGNFHNHRTWFKGPQLVDSPVTYIREDVFILCLDAEFAHGLDLSFITHLFLLEPIEDAALLEQVTSRAHRLGATGPVVVGTVNTLYKLNSDTQQAIEKNRISSTDTTNKLKDDVKKRLTTVVCHFCYRQFTSMAIAETHEQTCPRNPTSANIVDRFHLSSVYRTICPPPPIQMVESIGDN